VKIAIYISSCRTLAAAFLRPGFVPYFWAMIVRDQCVLACQFSPLKEAPIISNE